VCALGYFKDKLGNVKCSKCPEHSVAGTSRKSCKCKRGFFQATWERFSDNCTGIVFKFCDYLPTVAAWLCGCGSLRLDVTGAWSRQLECGWCNISKTSASVSSGAPNTEKRIKARGRPSAFIFSRCLEPLMKHEARVFGIRLLERVTDFYCSLIFVVGC